MAILALKPNCAFTSAHERSQTSKYDFVGKLDQRQQLHDYIMLMTPSYTHTHTHTHFCKLCR